MKGVAGREARLVGGLDDAHRRRRVGVDRCVRGGGVDRRVVEGCVPIGGVLYPPGVQVHLRDRVAGGAVDRCAGRQVCGVRAGDRGIVVGDRERPVEGDVAGVGQLVVVADRVADRAIGSWAGGLGEHQLGRVHSGDRDRAEPGDDVVAVEQAAAAGQVGDAATIQIALRDGVGGVARDRGVDGQRGVGRAGHGRLVV